MGLFDLFGKKKEVSGCTSCAGCAMAGRCSSAKPQVSSVKVLGVGCEAMYEDALLAVKELGLLGVCLDYLYRIGGLVNDSSGGSTA